MVASSSVSKYLETLHGNAVQKALENKSISTYFLAFCIENGIVDCNDEALLFEIEKSVGQRLHPKNPPTMNLASGNSGRVSSTVGMPVVGCVDGGLQGEGKLPFEKNMPTEAMFQETVKVIDAKIASNCHFAARLFNQCIKYNARKDWCTPELMKALLMDPSYVDKLRAAMYPSMVSYCERIFTDGGKTYVVPYITIIDESKIGENCGAMTCEKGMWNTTFYLNNNGGIGMMAGKVYQMYEVSDFSSKDAIKRYMDGLEAEFKKENKDVPKSNYKRIFDREWKPVEEFLKPYATGKKPIENSKALMDEFMRLHKSVLGGDTIDYFLNLKTRKEYRTVIRNNIKEIRRYGNDWFKVFDATNCVVPGTKDVKRELVAGEFERQNPGSTARIKKIADESLRRLHGKMFGTAGNEEWLGREEYDKECPLL